MIISAKRLSQMAMRWERIADIGRKTLTSISAEVNECCTSADGRYFNVPLAYLCTTIFVELLRISQEKFGFRTDGGIKLPCYAAEMDYVMCLLRRNASYEVERAFLCSLVRPCHHEYCLAPPMGLFQHIVVSSF